MQLLAMEAAARLEVMEIQQLCAEMLAVGNVTAYVSTMTATTPIDARETEVLVDSFATIAQHNDALLQIACDR